MTQENARLHGRSAYVLPTLFTLLNLLLGYYAIVKAVERSHAIAALLVLVAALLDKLDGLVARKMQAESPFGRELDSLADVVSFGVAPALIAATWGLDGAGRIGWGVSFWYLACGSLRLARFNVTSGSIDRRWFVGLPIPMAAAVPMTLVLSHGLRTDARVLPAGPSTWAFLLLVAAVAVLMVSNVRYFAFKDFQIARQRRLWLVLGLTGVLVAIVSWPAIVLPGLALGYAAHGPALWLFRLANRESPRQAPAP